MQLKECLGHVVYTSVYDITVMTLHLMNGYHQCRAAYTLALSD